MTCTLVIASSKDTLSGYCHEHRQKLDSKAPVRAVFYRPASVDIAFDKLEAILTDLAAEGGVEVHVLLQASGQSYLWFSDDKPGTMALEKFLKRKLTTPDMEKIVYVVCPTTEEEKRHWTAQQCTAELSHANILIDRCEARVWLGFGCNLQQLQATAVIDIMIQHRSERAIHGADACSISRDSAPMLSSLVRDLASRLWEVGHRHFGLVTLSCGDSTSPTIAQALAAVAGLAIVGLAGFVLVMRGQRAAHLQSEKMVSLLEQMAARFDKVEARIEEGRKSMPAEVACSVLEKIGKCDSYQRFLEYGKALVLSSAHS